MRCSVLNAGGEQCQWSSLSNAGEDVDAELNGTPRWFDVGVQDASASSQDMFVRDDAR